MRSGNHFKQFLLFAPAKSIMHRQEGSLYERTKAIIKSKIDLIRKQLEARDSKGDENIIVLGSEDFFKSILPDSCFDMDAAYEMIATEFIRLSRDFPKAIICPGSMYLSTPIPESHYPIKFAQDEVTNASLSKTLCYTTSIMPVLYNGELLRLIRKGERVKTVTTKGKTLKLYDSAEEFDIDHPKKIIVFSYHEDELTSMKSDALKKSSTCYLGKTLLPGERIILLKHFRNNPHLIDLFNHEVTIQGQSFCIIICAEFRCLPQNPDSSTTGKLLTKHHDYVLHATIGGDIDEHFIRNCRYYIHSDEGTQSKVLVEHTQELEENKTADENLFIRQYKS